MNSKKDLSQYRIHLAWETLDTAKMCYEHEKYRDANNRTYYAVFYAIRSVLALEGIDFKRHKDVLAYFNKTYVATWKMPRQIGRRISKLKIIREESDYNDLYVISKTETQEQIESAEYICKEINFYLENFNETANNTN